MASIIYNKAMDCFVMYRGALDEKGIPIGEYYREYMKEHPTILDIKNIEYDKKLKMIHSTKYDLFKIFNINNDIELTDKLIISNDFDCWVCFDGNFRVVLYFGSDKPIREEKCYKTICNDVKKWKYYNISYGSKIHEVKKWNVKHENKLLIAGLGYRGVERFFPELFDRIEYRSQITTDYLWNLEPFRIKRNWDIPEDIKQEMKELEEKKAREKELERLRLEELKRTPGYCDKCGDKAYYKIETPYSVTELCEYCYHDMFYYNLDD